MLKKVPVRILIVYSFFLCFSLLTNAQNNPSSKDGFVKLFNGQNFDGWHLKLRSGDEELAKKIYAIEDGMVHVFNNQFPNNYNLNTGKNETHGLFYTDKKYSKYILRFEYKWGDKIANNFNEWQYDAGCYYHVSDDKIWPIGIEYQVRYNHVTKRNHTGDFWVSGEHLDWTATKDSASFLLPKDGGILLNERNSELYGCANPKYNALNNKWNKCEVIVMGNEYTIHKLNGKIINMGSNLSVGEGIIGFQSETAEIFYRNIEIKEFDEIVPMEMFLK